MTVSMRQILTAEHLRTVHLVLAFVWLMPGVPAAWYISYRLPPEHAAFAILLVSLWANAYAGISAWQGARAEVAAHER